MTTFNKEHLQELKDLELLLLENIIDNLKYKRLYEMVNNDIAENDGISISDGENNIFSGLTDSVFDFISYNYKYSNSIINTDTKSIRLKNYYELLETIDFLIGIVKLELDS